MTLKVCYIKFFLIFLPFFVRLIIFLRNFVTNCRWASRFKAHGIELYMLRQNHIAASLLRSAAAVAALSRSIGGGYFNPRLATCLMSLPSSEAKAASLFTPYYIYSTRRDVNTHAPALSCPFLSYDTFTIQRTFNFKTL